MISIYNKTKWQSILSNLKIQVGWDKPPTAGSTWYQHMCWKKQASNRIVIWQHWEGRTWIQLTDIHWRVQWTSLRIVAEIQRVFSPKQVITMYLNWGGLKGSQHRCSKPPFQEKTPHCGGASKGKKKKKKWNWSSQEQRGQKQKNKVKVEGNRTWMLRKQASMLLRTIQKKKPEKGTFWS